MKELEYLENYLITEYEIDILFGREEIDAFYYDDDFISINTNHDKEIQLFCLLHEAGHLILRRRVDFSVDYPHVAKEGKTQVSRIDIIREEIDAWSEGKQLAGFLGFSLDEKRWDRYWKRQVYKYVKWSVNKEK